MKATKLLLALGLMMISAVGHAQSFVWNTNTGDSTGGLAAQSQTDNSQPFVIDRQGFVRIAPLFIVQDDFGSSQITSATWLGYGGTSGGATPTIITSQSGVVSMTSGNSQASAAAGNSQINAAVPMFRAANGGLSFETRLMAATSDSQVIFAGLMDATTSTIPMQISATSLTSRTFTAGTANFVGLVFDNRSSISQTVARSGWVGMGNRNGVSSSAVFTGVPVTANAWVTLRVNVAPTGRADYFINGRLVGNTAAGTVNSSTLLVPAVGVMNTNSTTRNVLVDYIQASQRR
ncbi:hypothetical protein EBZ38_03840 [bacterium]|nr:hypothetical protein [bacterium]